jgi:hypothetical protein
MSEFQTQCANLLKARFPLLYLSTWEEERALASIRAIAQDPALIKTPRTVYVWKQTTGLSADGRPGREETRAPVKALEVVEGMDEAALFVFLDFHAFFGGPGGRVADPAVVRKVRDLVPALKNGAPPQERDLRVTHAADPHRTAEGRHHPRLRPPHLRRDQGGARRHDLGQPAGRAHHHRPG